MADGLVVTLWLRKHKYPIHSPTRFSFDGDSALWDRGNLWWDYGQQLGEHVYTQESGETFKGFCDRTCTALNTRYDADMLNRYDWSLRDVHTGEERLCRYAKDKCWVIQ